MTTRILAALAAACIATPVLARNTEPFGPACLTANAAEANAHAHGAVIRLTDGEEVG